MGDGDLMLIARGRLWGLASAILLTSLITDATRGYAGTLWANHS